MLVELLLLRPEVLVHLLVLAAFVPLLVVAPGELRELQETAVGTVVVIGSVRLLQCTLGWQRRPLVGRWRPPGVHGSQRLARSRRSARRRISVNSRRRSDRQSQEVLRSRQDTLLRLRRGEPIRRHRSSCGHRPDALATGVLPQGEAPDAPVGELEQPTEDERRRVVRRPRQLLLFRGRSDWRRR